MCSDLIAAYSAYSRLPIGYYRRRLAKVTIILAGGLAGSILQYADYISLTYMHECHECHLLSAISLSLTAAVMLNDLHSETDDIQNI